ncbi:hypothetical protein [Streptomyces sp. NPDC094149]
MRGRVRRARLTPDRGSNALYPVSVLLVAAALGITAASSLLGRLAR